MKNEETEVVEASTEASDPIPMSFSRLRETRYPDREFADDTEFEDEILAYFDSTDSQLAKHKDDNDKIYDLISNNPEMAAVIEDVSKGLPFSVALARHVDIDALTPEEGEPDYEEYGRMLEEKKKRRSEYDAKLAEIEANKQISSGEVMAFFEDEGMDEGDRLEFVGWVDGIFDDLQTGTINKKTLQMLLKAKRYDEDVESAREAGEVEGRNQKIESNRKRKKKTDGLASMGVGSSPENDIPPKRSLIGRVGERVNGKRIQF